jgi:hypothetical protein
MATATIQDYRRTDLRTNVLETPYWITSSVIDGALVSGLKDKACVLFSFPTANQQVFILGACFEVITEFTATTVIDVGSYTLATNAVTTAGDATLVDVDDYIPQADITATTAGYYWAATGDLVASMGAGTAVDTARKIVGAATTVPCIAATLQTATVVAGQGRLHMLVTILPGT